MSDTNNGNSTQNTNGSTTQSEINRSGYDWLMKSVGTEPAAQMRPITEGFSLLKESQNPGNE